MCSTWSWYWRGQHQRRFSPIQLILAQQLLEYLGHILADKGVEIAIPRKLLPLSTGLCQLLLNWAESYSEDYWKGSCRKFVQDYGIMASPFTSLLHHKVAVFVWLAQKAFCTLKQAMTKTPVRRPELPLEIDTDACDTGVGAVLSQSSNCGTLAKLSVLTWLYL